jgi:lipoate-protein ligase B
MPEIWVVQLGSVPYADGVALQDRIRARRQADELPDVLLLLEHPPVYTKGRRSEPADLPLGEAWYHEQGIEIVDSNRGGRVTYHGPGQLVGYPIMRVGDVPAFVGTMETAIVAGLEEEGVAATAPPDETGVWVDDAKIASIGVHVSRGVTTHGFAINVDNDLRPFSWIVPCGMQNARMTSLAATTGRSASLPCFRKRIAYHFAEAVGRRQRLVSLDRLGAHEAEPEPALAVGAS